MMQNIYSNLRNLFLVLTFFSSMQSLLMQPLSPVPFSSLSNLSKFDMTENYLRNLPPERPTFKDCFENNLMPENGIHDDSQVSDEAVTNTEEILNPDEEKVLSENENIFSHSTVFDIHPEKYLIEEKLQEVEDEEPFVKDLSKINVQSEILSSRSISRASEATLLCSFDESEATSRTLVDTPDVLDCLSELSCDLTE